uniref:uncharacterized protein LOC100651786 n=1 Tax=Bombus terrestris TaxID=30195 RepID=A0A6P3UI34_BOMTE
MDTDMSGAVECKKKKRNRGKCRPFVPPLKRTRKPGRRGGAKGRSRVLKRLRGSTSMEGSNGAATTPSSNPDGTSVTDPTLSDEAPLSHRQALLWPKWQIQMPVPRPALRRRFLMECWKPIHATIP